MSIHSRLCYIENSNVNRPADGEAALRSLLAKVRTEYPVKSIELGVMNHLAANLKGQNRLKEYEIMGNECVIAARASGQSAKKDLIVALTHLARAQYMLGKNDLAERHQRESVVNSLAIPADLPLAIRSLSRLESWIREWGRTTEADKLKEEIDNLVERDTADKEGVY